MEVVDALAILRETRNITAAKLDDSFLSHGDYLETSVIASAIKKQYPPTDPISTLQLDEAFLGVRTADMAELPDAGFGRDLDVNAPLQELR